MRLTLRFNWASKTKFALLTLLVAVGMTVFLVVTELSRVSTEGLEDAIEADTGATGSYNVSIDSDFGWARRNCPGRSQKRWTPMQSVRRC